MPTRAELEVHLQTARNTAQDNLRRGFARKLQEKTGRDVIVYASAFSSMKANQVPGWTLAITQQDIQSLMAAMHGLNGDSLDLILHSPGGSPEAADQIVQYLRRKYGVGKIRAIIPQNAMSAATMIACACDEIVMGKQSAIGPIDPQMIFPAQVGQRAVAAKAVLDEFGQALADLTQNDKLATFYALRFRDYPPGFFHSCVNAIENSKQLVEQWLKSYMFKGQPDGEKKASTIAEWLSKGENHRTHGRPIGIDLAREQGLNVTPLEADQEFQDLVLSLFHATSLTFDSTECVKLVESHIGKGFFTRVALQKAN